VLIDDVPDPQIAQCPEHIWNLNIHYRTAIRSDRATNLREKCTWMVDMFKNVAAYDQVCRFVGIRLAEKINDETHVRFRSITLRVGDITLIETDPTIAACTTDLAQKIALATSDLKNILSTQIIAFDQTFRQISCILLKTS
jgi:hypothetical protein